MTIPAFIRPLAILALSLPLLPGCYYDVEQELYPGGFCDVSNVTWANDIGPLITTRCAVSGCHASGSSNGSITNYAEVSAGLSAITNRVLVVKDMPKNSSLPPCDLKKFQAWVEAGAPNN